MSKELVIGSNRHETKVAILEDDQLVEIYFQRGNEYSLAGSIHKGRVTRVLPGMQSAFVDLGLDRDTFLYVSDFFEENDDIDTVADEKPARGDRRDRGQGRGGERLQEARPASVPTLVKPIELEAETALAEGVEGSEPGKTTAQPIEAAADAKSQGDRGFRQGDRRGRRGRRRRSRGRGFPETKYAQSPAASPGEQAEVSEIEAEESESETEAEVIILPGESLAKYRHATASPAAEPAEEQEPVTAEEQAPPTSEVVEEAEEIELSDKVFSHRGTFDPIDEEEKIGQLKQESVPSSFVVDDIEGEEELLQVEPVIEQPFPQSAVDPLEEAVPGKKVVRIDELTPGEQRALHEAARLDAEQSQAEALVAGLEEAERETEEGEEEETEAEENELDFAEAAEADVEAQEPASEENRFDAESGGNPGAQTAVVREPGGRIMHRASRRMRRRRGNRSGFQQGQESTISGPAPAAAQAGPVPISEVSPRSNRESEERVLPSIADLLKSGQEIIVQIAKEPLGQKGARITSHIALPGRYVVFMPSVNHLGVSRKIASDEERQRLKRVLQANRVGTTGGFIVRTAGEGVPDAEIAADMNFLYTLWLDIRQKAEKKPAPVLLHYDLDIVQRVLRDQLTEEFKASWVDNEEMYESVLSFVQRFQPALVGRVKMYTRSAPIFDAFSITQELEKALRPKVWLKSGGYIVINQTEALVAIDINTGKYVGKSNRLEDTIVKTNLEAVKEIARQIRLRDLSGIIVVDFIDMDERKNRQKVMQALEDAMRDDRAPYKILQFNDFGLVAITRKRVKQSLERALCSPCPYCEGAGYVRSVQTVIGEIMVEAQKIAKTIESRDVVLRVHPSVAKVLKASNNRYLEEIEEILSRPVLVAGDPALHHEKFDLA
jgi:ribonuclease G